MDTLNKKAAEILALSLKDVQAQLRSTIEKLTQAMAEISESDPKHDELHHKLFDNEERLHRLTLAERLPDAQTFFNQHMAAFSKMAGEMGLEKWLKDADPLTVMLFNIKMRTGALTDQDADGIIPPAVPADARTRFKEAVSVYQKALRYIQLVSGEMFVGLMDNAKHKLTSPEQQKEFRVYCEECYSSEIG